MPPTLVGWQPSTPNTYVRPVQVESAASGITVAELPDGRGIAMWPNGGRARFAIKESVAALVTNNNIVTASEIRTAVTWPGLHRTAIYSIDGEIYCTINWWNGSGGKTGVAIYQASDPDNPTSWWLVSTLQDDWAPGTHFGSAGNWGAGAPTKLMNGRWVLGQGGWEAGLPSNGAASGEFSHVYTSDNGAAGPWTRRLYDGHYLSGFPRTQWTASQCAQDPATGDVFFSSYSVNINAVRTYRSQDNGTTWTIYAASNGVLSSGAWLPTYALDNGVQLFGGESNHSDSPGYPAWLVNSYNPGDITNTNVNNGGWSDTGGRWAAPGMDWGHETMKMLVVGNRVVSSTTDQIAATETTLPGSVFVHQMFGENSPYETQVPTIDDVGTSGGYANSGNNAALGNVSGQSFFAAPFVSNYDTTPSLSPARGPRGIIWGEYWNSDIGDTAMRSYLDNHPAPPSSPPDSTDLTTGTWGIGRTIVCELSWSTLQQYTSAAPLNIFGAKSDGFLRMILLQGYADATHVYVRCEHNRNTTTVTAYTAFPISKHNLLGFRMWGGGLETQLAWYMDDGTDH